MKNILIILCVLMLTGCTREYFVFMYIEPVQKFPSGQAMLPVLYTKDPCYPGCTVNHFNGPIDTASFLYRLNRGDFKDGSLTGKLSDEDLKRIKCDNQRE